MYKALDRWLIPYLKQRRFIVPDHLNIIFCFCDHFEPKHHAHREEANRRIREWLNHFPSLAMHIKELFHEPLCWTFFYPIEQWDQEEILKLKELCDQGLAEIGIHLHHHHDTANHLKEVLICARDQLTEYQLLPISSQKTPVYSFVHGNWAINNVHPQKRFCGVDEEINILLETGCIADFTMPSAPDPSQIPLVNQIAWIPPLPGLQAFYQARSVQRGYPPPETHLLLVTGPLNLNWYSRKWGILPRIENGELSARNPPTLERFHLWVQSGIRVHGWDSFVFIKLHTHGAYPENLQMILHGPFRNFWEQLRLFLEHNHPTWQCYFCTAREVVNLIFNLVQPTLERTELSRDVPFFYPKKSSISRSIGIRL